MREHSPVPAGTELPYNPGPHAHGRFSAGPRRRRSPDRRHRPWPAAPSGSSMPAAATPPCCATASGSTALFDRLIAVLRLTPVAPAVWHTFPAPGGLTGFVILAESHLACHTFPEFGSICVNVFCCRPRDDFDAAGLMAEMLGATDTVVRRIERTYGEARSRCPAGESRQRMRGPAGRCPNCGAPVRFRWSSAVQTTCESCRSVIVRHDVDLETIGEIADLPPDSSPIQIGTTGTLDGRTLQRRRPHRLRVRRRRVERVACRLRGRHERLVVGRPARICRVQPGPAAEAAARRGRRHARDGLHVGRPRRCRSPR